MEQLTKRLTDTATILDSISRVIDLADDRELPMLAALIKGYAECGGPADWQSSPGYLEYVAFAALLKEGEEITKDDVAGQEYGVLSSGLDYMLELNDRIPDEDEYVARYCERYGIDGIAGWNFYLAISFFRLAAICQGVFKRGLDGNASSAEAGKYGAVTRLIAEAGCAVID